MADELTKHDKTRGVDPDPARWAEELVGALGLAAMELTPDELRQAVRRGLPEIETGATEGRVRKVIRWKITDAPKDAKRARRDLGEDGEVLAPRATEGGADAWYERHTRRRP